MKFSTKSRYALRLMAELARYAPGTTVSLKEISERQNLSLKYLEQIVTPLARVGLVKSERGSQGGYRLTKAPADYTAGEILRAIEGSVAQADASIDDFLNCFVAGEVLPQRVRLAFTMPIGSASHQQVVPARNGEQTFTLF